MRGVIRELKMEKQIRKVLQTWKTLRKWQNTGDDGAGNTCGPALFEAHTDALLELEALLQPEDSSADKPLNH